MILYLTHLDIDKKKWDECIAISPQGIAYAYSWYLDCVTEKRWDALVMDDYKAVMPLTWNKKAGIFYLYQPFFTQQLGVFSKDIITKKLVNEFLKSIPEKYRFIEINLNHFNEISSGDFTANRKVTHHLELNKPYIKIFASYRDNLKRNLKTAQKKELKISLNISPAELINLFKNNQGKKIKELKEKHYVRLEKLMNKAIENGTGEISGVRNAEKEIVSAAFFVKTNTTVIYLFTSSNDEGRSIHAPSQIIDSYLCKYVNLGFTFDFEGSEIASVAQFYKGFGGVPVYYFAVRRNNLPWHLKWIKEI